MVCLLLAIAEVSTRWFLTSPSAQDFDPELGWKWRPGATIFNAAEGGARLTINEHGLNDDPIGDKAGRYRMAVLGNSFTEAIQVPREENFTSQTERMTGADVINLGRSAMTGAHYPIVMRRFAWLEPDLIVVAVGQSDLVNILSGRVEVERDAAGTIVRLSPVLEGKDELKQTFGPLLQRSALVTWMMRRMKPVIMGWRAKLRGGSEDDAPAAEDPDAWQEAAARLAFVLKDLASQGAEVVLLDLPHIEYRPERQTVLGSEDERRAYRAAAEQAGVVYVDTYDALRQAYADTGQPAHGFHNLTIGHGHLNGSGHRAVAEALSAWVTDRTALADAQRAPGPVRPPPPGGTRRAESNLSAVWANDGGDKVTRRELRATKSATSVHNSVWDGRAIRVFGGRNEVVSFNLVLEAGANSARRVSVSLERLDGAGGASIGTARRLANQLFDFRGRNIELFFVRYLQIKGLSTLTWGNYDERHVPERFRRSHDLMGIARGGWTDRPDANTYYPDIAVPLELVDRFGVPATTNQSIWCDIVIPKDAKPGTYRGAVTIKEGNTETWRVPVELTVRGFTLPDTPAQPVFLQLGYADVNHRYLGEKYPSEAFAGAVHRIRDRHFMLAHRHKIDLIDANLGPAVWTEDAPRPEWRRRLSGELFTAANGYDGPGVGVPNGVFSIGTYESWSWRDKGQAEMIAHSNRWAGWFGQHFPKLEYFLYLADESTDTARMEKWAEWVRGNPGAGSAMRTLATVSLPVAIAKVPMLDIPTSSLLVGPTRKWEMALQELRRDPRKRFFMYNGARPACGSLALEDDGIALRLNGWVHFKKGVDRWFYWESTYYNNFQGGTGETNVFQRAQTFGGTPQASDVYGLTGWNYTNGDGVLFYPGTDRLYPTDSYDLTGPIASLRLKHIRRGIQDGDYLTLAAAANPARVQALVERMIPKVLWENGVDNPVDPTYTHTAVSWSSDPDVWEKARRELADIIEGQR